MVAQYGAGRVFTRRRCKAVESLPVGILEMGARSRFQQDIVAKELRVPKHTRFHTPELELPRTHLVAAEWGERFIVGS